MKHKTTTKSGFELLIHKALMSDRNIQFDYVSKDHEISYNRFIKPVSLQTVGKKLKLKLYGMDMKKNLMRCFDMEGIMKLSIV